MIHAMTLVLHVFKFAYVSNDLLFIVHCTYTYKQHYNIMSLPHYNMHMHVATAWQDTKPYDIIL